LSEPEPDLAALRRAFAAIPPVAPAPESCPSSESILAAVRGELPPAELRDLIAHLATCPACAEDWRLAAALEHPMTEDPAAEASPETTPWRTRRRRLAVWCTSAAAAAALAIGGLLWQAPVPVLRGGGKPPQLLSTAENRDDCLLRWSETLDATYDLDVETQSGQIVVRAHGLLEPRYRVPAARFTHLPPATVLSWRVTANLPGGHRLVSKSTFLLR
jgi:hypothetical protein